MNRKSLAGAMLGTALLLAATGIAYSVKRAPDTKTPAAIKPITETLEAAAIRQLPNYKKWTRANAKPKLVFSYLIMLCGVPAPPELAKLRKEEAGNPHNDKYIVVYVNDKGKKTLLHDKKPTYPVGTLIVKQKLAKSDSVTPELCTVMLKREAGYNAQGGDWEYFVTDGAGAQIQASGKLQNCVDCHAKQKSMDYVYRQYLPDIAYRYERHQSEKAQHSRQIDVGKR